MKNPDQIEYIKVQDDFFWSAFNQGIANFFRFVFTVQLSALSVWLVVHGFVIFHDDERCAVTMLRAE